MEMEKVSQVPAEMELDRHCHQLQRQRPPPQRHWLAVTGKTGTLAIPSYSTA